MSKISRKDFLFRHLVSNFEVTHKRIPTSNELKEIKKSAIRLSKGEMANKRANKRRRYAN